MLVDAGRYDQVYRDLDDYWKTMSFIPHRLGASWQQARWACMHQPLAERFWGDVDVVYCPAESFIPTKKAKLVCTIHDIAGFEPDLYPGSTSQLLHRGKWRILFEQMARYADAVVTVSEFSASRISRFFPRLESKLHVIYNAPHDIFGTACDSEDRKRIEALSGGKPFVLVPGGLSLRKNAALILEALPHLASELPDVKVIIAGSNSGEYLARLEKLECNNHVLAGYVSDKLLNALYQHAEVAWFPSRYEGFGMPVIEAMSAGVPVVASNATAVPEVAGDAAILCHVDNPRSHAEAIRSVHENPVLRSEMIEKGRARAARFTWDASAIGLNRLFCSI